MIVDFTAQTVPLLWFLIAALVLMALFVFACIDPELAEVYLGDWQLVAAAMALVALLVVIGSERPAVAHQFWLMQGPERAAAAPSVQRSAVR